MKYKFEWNDLRALTTLVNVVLIMIYGLSISWFGLGIAILGMIKDLTDKEFRWNGFIMHLSNAILIILKGDKMKIYVIETEHYGEIYQLGYSDNKDKALKILKNKYHFNKNEAWITEYEIIFNNDYCEFKHLN